jgi:hypothetical protein
MLVMSCGLPFWSISVAVYGRDRDVIVDGDVGVGGIDDDVWTRVIIAAPVRTTTKRPDGDDRERNQS